MQQAEGAGGWEVVVSEHVYDIIVNTYLSLLHVGSKIFKAINERYYAKVEVFFTLLRSQSNNNRLDSCSNMCPSNTRAQLQPVVVTELWERVQTDMRGNLDGESKCIRDHFSKLSAAFALKTKAANKVANVVMCWISLFGPQRILQCDNDKEFKGNLLILVKGYGT